MSSLLIKLFKTKLRFKKPKNKSFLIYDYASFLKGTHKFLFKNKKNIGIFYSRGEELNIYVLILTIFKKGLKNLILNYKKTYLELIKPKVIFTSIDHDPMFFALKIIYPNAKYISDQHGFSKVVGYKWPHSFFFRCKSIAKKLGQKKLKADIIFVFNEYEKLWMSKIIDSKFYILGNTVNNYYNFKKNKKKQKEILFISLGLYKNRLKIDKKVFNNTYKICEKNNFKLSLLSRHNSKFEKKYREIFISGKWLYIPIKSKTSSYEAINNHNIILSTGSSLGFEALSRNKKCIFFLNSFIKKILNWRFNNEGFFWTTYLSEKNIEKIILRVKNSKLDFWKKTSRKLATNMLAYDKNNMLKKKIIKKVIYS